MNKSSLLLKIKLYIRKIDFENFGIYSEVINTTMRYDVSVKDTTNQKGTTGKMLYT